MGVSKCDAAGGKYFLVSYIYRQVGLFIIGRGVVLIGLHGLPSEKRLWCLFTLQRVCWPDIGIHCALMHIARRYHQTWYCAHSTQREQMYNIEIIRFTNVFFFFACAICI